MKYKSKVDWWYYIIVLLFSYCTFRVCYSFYTIQNSKEHPLLVILFLLCEFFFLLPNLLFTYYILEEDCMYIRSGYFIFRCIVYNDIVKIRDTRSIFSAGGLGLDRIEITYKYKDSIDTALISPKEKDKVKKKLEKKMKKQNVTDLSGFGTQEGEGKNQPINGIIH